MKRVVVTGMGINSCLGNDLETVKTSLYEGKSGITHNEPFEVVNMRSTISGNCGLNPEEHIPHNIYRFMGPSAGLAYLSLKQAIEDAGLTPGLVSNPRTGLIMGSSSSSSQQQHEAADIMRDRGVPKVGPYRVFKTMNSTVSANLATAFKIQGLSFTIASACTTSLHCIGEAYEKIQAGKQDIIFAGGSEAEHWTLAGMLDAARALSSRYNDTPERASRPYDKNRDGFVIGSGAGALVLEEYSHALKRGAKIYAEIVGYGATSDGFNISAPSGEGAMRCMQLANADKHKVDYINTHGTATPKGDIVELRAIRAVFGDDMPMISSTKSLSGHGVGAAGVHEAIFSILMMNHNFIAASANIDELDPEAEGYPIVMERCDFPVDVIMSNSFGFGGTNGSIILKKIEKN